MISKLDLPSFVECLTPEVPLQAITRHLLRDISLINVDGANRFVLSRKVPSKLKQNEPRILGVFASLIIMDEIDDFKNVEK